MDPHQDQGRQNRGKQAAGRENLEEHIHPGQDPRRDQAEGEREQVRDTETNRGQGRQGEQNRGSEGSGITNRGMQREMKEQEELPSRGRSRSESDMGSRSDADTESER